MNITWREESGAKIGRLAGRLDGHSAKEASRLFADIAPAAHLVLDCGGLSYLSSAGVRFLLHLQKTLAAGGGALALAGVQPFCASVLEMSGLSGLMPVFATVSDALASLCVAESVAGECEKYQTEQGTFVFHAAGNGIATIDVLGDIANVIDCAITKDLVVDKPFFETEYSLGLGALGASPEDYLPVMGEAVMLAGTMVWLPTDGNDTPDYMIPRKASTAVVLHTGFNASLRGGFNEFVEFRAPEARPAAVGGIYRTLFDLAKKRRPDFRGMIGVAMRAEIHEAFGAGITRSPLLANRPANGRPITDASNFAEWFESDRSPRHRGTTALICGAGVDLTADLSAIDAGPLRRMFYVNPANRGAQTEALHNHAVFFTSAPPPAGSRDMDVEMRRVVETAEFVDMRHLLDQTTVRSALIGVGYVQEVREDTKR